MSTRMLQRRGTAAEWAAVNPILGEGEIGFEKDTGLIKIGDGVTRWMNIQSPYISRTLIDAKGDLLVGTLDNTVGRLARGTTGQRLTVQADGSLGWETPTVPTPPIPIALMDAVGDLVVGTGADTAGRLPRGATGQRLTVNADGTLGWVNMPDLSVYETSAHALATYETSAHASATYETSAHASATYGDKTAAAQQIFTGAGGVRANGGLFDGANRVYSAGNLPDLSSRVLKTGDTMTGELQVDIAAGIGTTVGSILELSSKRARDANVDYIIQRLKRRVAGTDWSGVDLEILRKVDASEMGGLQFRNDGVHSFNGGLYDNADRVYSASNPPPAPDLSSRVAKAGDTMTGVLTVPALAASGLTGAIAASRYVGATTSGAPTAGTFLKGDWIIDQTAAIWVCTAAGTPGTWAKAGGASGGGPTVVAIRTVSPAANNFVTSGSIGTRFSWTAIGATLSIVCGSSGIIALDATFQGLSGIAAGTAIQLSICPAQSDQDAATASGVGASGVISNTFPSQGANTTCSISGKRVITGLTPGTTYTFAVYGNTGGANQVYYQNASTGPAVWTSLMATTY